MEAFLRHSTAFSAERPRISAVLEAATPSRWPNKGTEIRAKIAANRAKRLSIAGAMKKEASVTEHTVHKEDFAGLRISGPLDTNH